MINQIPTPKKLKIENEAFHPVNPFIFSHNPQWASHLDFFKEMFFFANDIRLENKKGGIELFLDENLNSGTYVIDSKDTIKLFAGDKEGVLYGLSSLIQLIDCTEGMRVQSLYIEDYPEKDYRGVMIDLGRQWHPFSKLLKYVDLCFLYKIKLPHKMK